MPTNSLAIFPINSPIGSSFHLPSLALAMMRLNTSFFASFSELFKSSANAGATASKTLTNAATVQHLALEVTLLEVRECIADTVDSIQELLRRQSYYTSPAADTLEATDSDVTRMALFPAYLLKRHPFSMEAHFGFVFVLTYAFPKEILAPLLAPGLVLDTFGDVGFVAVAAVQTCKMRPRGFPDWISQDYLLLGYRIFVRYRTQEGRNLRGLRILRSETDSSTMVLTGNLLTHYGFCKSDIKYKLDDESLKFSSVSEDGLSELRCDADLSVPPDYLPKGSPFSSVREALKFAGPMPFTFDYEMETNSIIRVEGVRENWHPKSVSVDVQKISFFDQEQFAGAIPLHCSTFFLRDIPYYWKEGICEVLSASQSSTTAPYYLQTNLENVNDFE